MSIERLLLAVAFSSSVSALGTPRQMRLNFDFRVEEPRVLAQSIPDSTVMGAILKNPVNIRYSQSNSWKGQIGKGRGFVEFDSYESGYRAAYILLKNYIGKHKRNTLSKIAYRFAPPSENDTEGYIADISKHSEVDPHKVLTTDDSEDIARIIAAMTFRETSITVRWEDIHHLIINKWT